MPAAVVISDHTTASILVQHLVRETQDLNTELNPVIVVVADRLIHAIETKGVKGQKATVPQNIDQGSLWIAGIPLLVYYTHSKNSR